MSRLDVADAINSAADWVGKSPTVSMLVGNPFAASLLLTALVGVVIMAVFHYKVTGANVKQCARAGLYIYVATTLLLFLHYLLVSRRLESDSATGGARDLVSSIIGGARGGAPSDSYFPVVPGKEPTYSTQPASQTQPMSQTASQTHTENKPDLSDGGISGLITVVGGGSAESGSAESGSAEFGITDVGVGRHINPV